MSFKEVTILRKSGKIEEAYTMATSEYQASPDDIWAKKALGWVIYEQLKQIMEIDDLNCFTEKYKEFAKLQIPESDEMIYEWIAFPLAMFLFKQGKKDIHVIHQNQEQFFDLFHVIKEIPFLKNEWYVRLFKALHKIFKDNSNYLTIADWWDFSNFKEDNFNKEKLPDGMELLSIGEQAYITYAKHLLPKSKNTCIPEADKEKIKHFISKMDAIINKYPQLEYPQYFQAKLLLSLGDKENMLSALLPFAKKMHHNFWIWDIMADAYSDDNIRFACYCRALSCYSPEKVLVNLRLKMADLFIKKQMYYEAKTEIELVVKTRKELNWGLPAEYPYYQSQPWYNTAEIKKSNQDVYFKYKNIAENILFSDIMEEKVIVTNINKDKKILHFVGNEKRAGFFKYSKFFRTIQISDVLLVRFKSKDNEYYQAHTASIIKDDAFAKQFIERIEGTCNIGEGKEFGLIDKIYIPPFLIKKERIENGMFISILAIKSYNSAKQVWEKKGFKILNKKSKVA